MNISKLTLGLYCILISAEAFSTSLPESTHLQIKPGRPTTAEATSTYSLPVGDYCIYWPLNESGSIEDTLPIKGLDLWYQRTVRSATLPGNMRLSSVSTNFRAKADPQPAFFTPFSKTDSTPLVLKYTIRLPKRAFSKPNEVIYQNYLPLISQNCKRTDTPSTSRAIRVTIQAPRKWTILSPFRHSIKAQRVVSIYGFHGDFVLGSDYKLSSIKNSILDIQLYHRTESYSKLLPVIKKTLNFFTNHLGALPLKQIIIFESDYTTKADIPGLVAYLKPRQEFLKSLQEYWLNWSEWAVTAALAYQWFGAMIMPEHPNDSWLIHSLRDYYVLKALQQDANTLNLFNSYNHSLFDFKYTYSEFQDLTAFSLLRSTPKAKLTHTNLKSFIRLRHQNPLLFIRNVLMLRSLESIIGFQNLNRAITGLFPTDRNYRPLGPETFATDLLGRLQESSPHQTDLANHILRQWWTKAGWPERKLENFTVNHLKKNEYLVTAQIKEQGQLTIPSDIVIEDRKGREYFIPATTQIPDKRSYQLVINNPVKKITIDPKMLVFDSNRFNNSSQWPDLYFFPGNGRELYQGAYNLFWFPYLIKRPGESLRLGLQSTVLKYLRGGTTFNFEIDGKGKDTTFDLASKEETLLPGVNYLISAHKNFYKQRQVGVQININDINSSAIHPVNLYLVTRARQESTDNQTRHATIGLGLNMLPGWRPEPCNFSLSAEHEQTPKEQASAGIHYQRSYARVSGLCNITTKIQAQARFFRGVTKTLVQSPKNSFFWPNDLSEARLRIDHIPPKPHSWIRSSSFEILSPLYFPFNIGSYVLNEKIRLRFFYDYGEASRDTLYRSAGLGLILPLGGDISGAGALSITRISLLGAIYQRINNQQLAPSVLFDVSGEL